LGLTAGPVPPRVDAPVKQGLLDLIAYAHEHGGWSLRRSAAVLGIEHTRLLRWTVRAAEDRLADAKPGPGVPVHALLDWEREAIVKLAEDWAAQQVVAEWCWGFYNTQRRHSSAAMMSPVSFETTAALQPEAA